MTNMINTNLSIICLLFIIGFTINYFILRLILTGFIGLTLKNKLIKKIKIKDYAWFNKLILFFLFKYLINIYIFLNDIYLDSNTLININLDGVEVKVKGDYIDKLFINLGATSAFVIGSRLAAAFVTKHPMSLGSKIGTTIGAGALRIR